MGKLSGLLGYLNLWNDPPPSLLPREQEYGFYIKLHGSLDWLYCPNNGCPNNSRIFSLSVAVLADGQREGMPCRICGSALRTFIIPPVATKRLEDKGPLAFLWNLALRELTIATSISIIGISFAPTDFELRWLVRQAMELRQNRLLELHIVNKSFQHRKDIRTVFPGNIEKIFEYECLADYIAEHPILDL